MTRLERNIKGITNARVRDLIRDLQPFREGVNAGNHILGIIHEMDRIDKHRELILTAAPSANIVFPAGTPLEIIRLASSYTEGEAISPAQMAMVGREIKKNHQVTPDISFREIGKRKTQPVIPTLQQIANQFRDIVDLFSVEI